MKIGDRVVENVKQPRTMPLVLEGVTLMDEAGAPLWVQVSGIIESKGLACDWHIDWDDGRRTDQNEIYASGRREGEPCLILAD